MKEYAEKFYKASALKWAAIITTGILCLVYAIVVTSQPSHPLPDDIAEIITHRKMAYRDSPCILFVEVDKVISYYNCLAQYASDSFLKSQFIFLFITKLLVCAAVFYSICSAFSLFLLNKLEVLSIFKLLPGKDESFGHTPFIPNYFGAIIIILVFFSGFFVYIENQVERYIAEQPINKIDDSLNTATDWISLVSKGVTPDSFASLKAEKDSLQSQLDEFSSKYKELLSNREKQLLFYRESREELIDASVQNLKNSSNVYYEDCINHVKKYIDWSESIEGRLSRATSLGNTTSVREKFNEFIVLKADNNELLNEIESFKVSARSTYNTATMLQDLGILSLPVDLDMFKDILDFNSANLTFKDLNNSERSNKLFDALVNPLMSAEDQTMLIIKFIEDEKKVTSSSIDDLAKKIGDALEEAK